MRRLIVKLLLLMACCLRTNAQERNLVWGTEALALPGPSQMEPEWSALLSATSNVAVLNRFYRLGGEDAPVTPTECRLAYNAEALFIVFRCQEDDMNYPAKRHKTDWYAQLPSAGEQDSSYPDQVDVVLSPNVHERSYFQFGATLDGRSFGARRTPGSTPAPSDEDTPRTNVVKVTGFEAKVMRQQKAWIAFFRIPWQTLGGKPNSYFGFVPMRTRWRDSEVTSPVAGNFTDRPPLSSYIEVHFANHVPAVRGEGCLSQLPSGTWRWQRPALLTYPDAKTITRIWQMEQTLSRPTDKLNFGGRLYLAQRWTDLLELEGFTFRPLSGSIAEGDLSPSVIRSSINAALRENDPPKAWGLLSNYLPKLDAVSKKWFADGSPGDIRADQWVAVTTVKKIAVHDNVATLHCLAGTNNIDLHLSFPATGGIRLRADREGWFKPEALSSMTVSNTTDKEWIVTSHAMAAIAKKGFEISLSDSSGKDVVRLSRGSIAFRFDSKGNIVAVDFRNHLDRNEVIYGFGEKYDRFNQNGNVLTLWGVDAWNGNTVGLRNESYKPIPVFHSSKGYMVFLNSSYRLRADIGKTRPDEYRLTQQGPIFDDYFWIGSPEAALTSYAALTGKPLLPPKWAFEPWIGRTGRGWNDGPLHNGVAEEIQVIKQFEELDIPHSSIYAEGSGADSKALNTFVAAQGMHVLSWYYPAIGEDTQARLLPETERDKLPFLNAPPDGSDEAINYVDFSNPKALELSRRWWKPRLDLGVAGSMVDFGDRTPEGAVFFDGRKGDEMHNFYSYDYQRTYHDAFAERRGDDFILFGRAAAPGTQRWAAQFAGDHRANFVGLKAVLTGALNLCACGFSTWGSDLGGFLGWPDPAVYMRWTQFASFSPLMRSHGRTPREPWEFGDAAVANYKVYAWVRENLLDYIYQAAQIAHETGIPIMRSMAVAYPDKPSLATVADEYLFGPDLLVAPIINETNSRTISFPRGKWLSLWDGTAANDTSEVEAPLDVIPVYLRQGAVIPVTLSTNLQFGQSLTPGRTRALVINPPSKNFTVNNAGASYLLIYGAQTATITVDNLVLPRLQTVAQALASQGCFSEPTPRRLVVHLPQNARRIEIELGTEQASTLP
jgi:alpha-glucosidase (family GH31 glycosyl hydrolase)